MVNDFRYLGAHLNAKATCASKTMEKRWIKAGEQLKRLRFAQVEEAMKIRTILTKVYAAALYGIEAARVTPDKVGKLAAAVVDAFRSRNNSHNVDIFLNHDGRQQRTRSYGSNLHQASLANEKGMQQE